MEETFCNLSGKVALITGATSGIGAATAILFAKLGAQVSLTGRNSENLQKVVYQCLQQPGASQPHAVAGELTHDADVKKIVESTIKAFGRLDILVNSAGVIETGSIEATSMEQYDRVMNINLRSVYHITMLVVPHLISSKGCIVNVSSVCGTRSFPNVLTYCISKSAMDQFTNCIALELAAKGVRVNSVNPGVIVTELHKRAGMTQKAYDEFIERTKETHPLGRPGSADEVARSIAFLASDTASSFITGQQLHVDGGRHAACPR
jgi:NAD(P)-dependent dehydrogenase (short-subunit alcohol dehydrogenase family)